MPLQGVNVVEVGSHHVRAPSVFKDINGVNASSITGVWTPTSGTTWTLLGGTISVSVASSILFEDNTTGASNFVFRTPKLAADTAYTFFCDRTSSAANNVLRATASPSGTITGTIWGTEE